MCLLELHHRKKALQKKNYGIEVAGVPHIIQISDTLVGFTETCDLQLKIQNEIHNRSMITIKYNNKHITNDPKTVANYSQLSFCFVVTLSYTLLQVLSSSRFTDHLEVQNKHRS